MTYVIFPCIAIVLKLANAAFHWARELVFTINTT